jgi:hypothetical protein
MKKEIYLLRISVLLLILVIVFACRKSVAPTTLSAPYQSQHNHELIQNTQKVDSVSPIPYPQAPVLGCSYAPMYGDSIIFPQPTSGGSDYIVSPVNNPGQGTYMSWPQGLALNPTTGAIDVTQSQGGERFNIGFVQNGTTDTCITTLIVGGASYMDSVYVLANNASQAYPYFNADPYLASVCATSGVSGSCQFDVTGSAKSMHVIVNNNSGMIDLQKSLDQGAFGLLPLNGQAISPVIYYELNDGSNMALQNIQVNILYYYSKSQIGPSLLNNLTSKLNNILLNLLIMNQGNPRPPMIIITRFN